MTKQSQSHDALIPPNASPLKAEGSLAIALDHSGRSGTTRVTAKGRGQLAEQILTLAFAQGVKVRTDADLAAILDQVDVESEIPLEALAAVAAILTYLYETQRPKDDVE